MTHERFYAGGFFFNPKTEEILLHKRDGNTDVNPNKWGFFGGTSEEGEVPVETFIREIKEELGQTLKKEDIVELRNYLNKERNIQRYVFYVESDKKKSEMTLGEGADLDWISLDKVFDFVLTDKTVDDLNFFMETL